MNDSKREIRMSQINDPAKFDTIDDPVWGCEVMRRIKQTTVYTGPGYPLDRAKESERYTWPGMDWIVSPRPDPIIASMYAALERYEQETRISRTIRRVETIVNFKDEFGRGERPDWSEFAWPKDIWDLPECVAAGRLPE